MRLVEDPALRRACDRVLAALEARHVQFSMDGSRNIWLIKAPEACRGRGIVLHRKLEEILELADRFPGRVAQKYVEQTLTWERRKFDLRCWVLLVGGGSSDMECFIFEPFYARLCARPWALDDHLLTDEKRHLSNLAVNKGSEENLLGTQAELERLLRGRWPRVRRGIETIVQALAQAAHALAAPRARSFEFLGVDIILDADARPWLLECNLSPALARRNDDQSKLIDAALRGCLRRTVDAWCPSTVRRGVLVRSSVTRATQAPAPMEPDGWRRIVTLPAVPKLPKRNRLALAVNAAALDRPSLVRMDGGAAYLAASATLRAWWPRAMMRRRALVARRAVAAGGIRRALRRGGAVLEVRRRRDARDRINAAVRLEKVWRWRSAVRELLRRREARSRFLNAMQARIASVVRGRRALDRFQRLRGAAQVCIRVSTPRLYAALYARRLRAGRLAYETARGAFSATDATAARAAAAHSSSAVAAWSTTREAAATPIHRLARAALCRRRVARAISARRRDRARHAATRLQTAARRVAAIAPVRQRRATCRIARFGQRRHRGAAGRAAFGAARASASVLKLQTATRSWRVRLVGRRRRKAAAARARVLREGAAALRLQALAHGRRWYVRERARARRARERRAATRLQAARRRHAAWRLLRIRRARHFVARWGQRRYHGRRGRGVAALLRRLRRKRRARVTAATRCQCLWRGFQAREFAVRKRSSKFLVAFVRRALWEKLQSRAFGGRNCRVHVLRHRDGGSGPGEAYVPPAPPPEPGTDDSVNAAAETETAETASVPQDEDSVNAVCDDSDHEFAAFLEKFQKDKALDAGAFIDFHTIDQPRGLYSPSRLGSGVPNRRKTKRKNRRAANAERRERALWDARGGAGFLPAYSYAF